MIGSLLSECTKLTVWMSPRRVFIPVCVCVLLASSVCIRVLYLCVSVGVYACVVWVCDYYYLMGGCMCVIVRVYECVYMSVCVCGCVCVDDYVSFSFDSILYSYHQLQLS